MQEYRTGKAVVRIHGEVDYKRLEKATVTMLKKAAAKEEQKRKESATA